MLESVVTNRNENGTNWLTPHICTTITGNDVEEKQPQASETPSCRRGSVGCRQHPGLPDFADVAVTFLHLRHYLQRPTYRPVPPTPCTSAPPLKAFPSPGVYVRAPVKK